MKSNKKLWLFAITGLFTLFINSCQKDEENYQKSTKAKVQHISVNTLFQDADFKKSFSSVLPKKDKSNSVASRTIMEEQYGFAIIDQPASVIENDSIISYTLLIDKKDKETPQTLCNLVIESNKKHYLLKHT